MKFIHTGVHHQEFRRLVRGEDGPDEPIEPVIIGCPTCGQWYVADLAPDEEAENLEEQVWEAEERLLAECPDHAHRFEVKSR
jgi:hypothetical protein